jgi:hypothetical protein
MRDIESEYSHIMKRTPSLPPCANKFFKKLSYYENKLEIPLGSWGKSSSNSCGGVGCTSQSRQLAIEATARILGLQRRLLRRSKIEGD